jgi:hypothetical protein
MVTSELHSALYTLESAIPRLSVEVVSCDDIAQKGDALFEVYQRQLIGLPRVPPVCTNQNDIVRFSWPCVHTRLASNFADPTNVLTFVPVPERCMTNQSHTQSQG